MSSKNGHNGGCGKSDCDFERLNYYYGQMMVVRDFRDQQHYYNEKRWMLNRFGIGWGVLHGLKVTIRKDSHDGDGDEKTPPNVIIEPGFALDQNGNEIVICKEQCINISKLLGGHHHDEDQHHDGGHTSQNKGGHLPVYLGVRYRECGTEPFRLPDTHCCDIEHDCNFSRTRETQEFVASHTLWPQPEDEEVRDDHGCVIDCFRNLRNPSAKVIEEHPERVNERAVPLATLLFVKGRWIIDNFTIRPIAYSNYRLGELIRCLTGEMGSVHAAGDDRRRYIPLLAQTIPGLKYRSGRTKLHENFGELPFRITTDGRFIWCTDLQMKTIHRLPVNSHIMNPVPNIDLESEKSGWGISFDGHAIWVTIPAKNVVERINICTLEKRVFPLDAPFKHHGGHDDDAYGERRRDDTDEERYDREERPNNPREIVFDGHYLWISHGPQLKEEKETWSEWIEHEHQILQPDEKSEKSQKAATMYSEKVSKIFLTRLDPFTGKSKVFTVETKKGVSPVTAMAFDGHALWIAYNDAHHQAIAQRVKIIPHGPKQMEDSTPLPSDDPIELRGNWSRDIAFDGNAVWVTHDEGVSKIDIHEYNYVTNGDRGRLSSITCDGTAMWAVQNRETETELRRCDLFTLDRQGAYELHDGEHRFHIGRLCFDGSFLWAIGNKTDVFTSKGIIYRILP